MKRSVSILLAALTLALALSSCGSKNSGNTTDDSHQQESGMLDRLPRRTPIRVSLRPIPMNP